MSDVIVKFQLDINQAKAELIGFEKEFRTTEKVGARSFGAIANESKKTAKELDKATKGVDTLGSKLSGLADNLPFAGQAKQILELGSALTGSGNAAKGASVGVRVFTTALLATGIPLIIAAIAGLIAYFKRTDEGATRLAGVMAAFGAAMDLVTGSIISFGEFLFTAGRSFEDFGSVIQTVATEIGKYILNRALAPIFLMKDAFDALSLVIKGDTKAAFQELKNGVLQFITGFENLADKTDAFISKALKAAQAAYEWEKAMDALEDKIRDDSKVIAENDRAITKLIIASKNKTIQDEEALKLLDLASQKEKENLAIVLKNENARLALIKQRNARERESINQDKKALTDELALTETSAARKISILKQLRSINDNFAKEEVDQEVKIIGIKQSSDNLLEKIQNRRDSKEEEIFQNQLKRIAAEETYKENAAKEQFINGTTSAQELEDALYQIKLDGLLEQKYLLVSQGKDIVDTDKAILDLELQNLLKHNKDREAAEKALRDVKAKADKEANDNFLKQVEERLKEEDDLAKKKEDKKKEHKQKLNAIKASSIDVAETLMTGFYDISQQKRQEELKFELEASQKKTDEQANALQKRFDQGLITEENFNAQKAILDQKQATKEAEIKRKQFNADKKAKLIGIAMDTAVAVVKTIATLGLPAGFLASALAIAIGAAQAAVVSAQPVPKFAKGKVNIKGAGTGTSDSITAQISRGESVITAKGTANNTDLLEAINNGKEKDFIKDTYISPVLAKMEADNNRKAKARRESREKSLMSRDNNVDMSRTNDLLKKNGTVKVANVSEIAKELRKDNYHNSRLFR